MGNSNNVFNIDEHRNERARIAGMGAHQVDRYSRSDADAQRSFAARSQGGLKSPGVSALDLKAVADLLRSLFLVDVDGGLRQAHAGPVPHAPQELGYNPEIWQALASLESHGASRVVAGKALSTWARLVQVAPPEPEIELPNGAVRFTWSFEELYLHLDVLDDGFSWFFEDDRAQVVGGTRGDTEPTIPAAFFENLSKLRAAT